MGKAPKLASKATNAPGPGAYEDKGKEIVKGFSMPGRHGQRKPEMVPGPGMYNAQADQARMSKEPTTVKMVAGPSRPARTLFGIGPGSYEVKDTKEKVGGKFARSNRSDFTRVSTSRNPGPGMYQPAVTQSFRSDSKVSHITPSYS